MAAMRNSLPAKRALDQFESTALDSPGSPMFTDLK
jgi:hypothetical protein